MSLTASRLRCEHLVAPLGVDRARPVFAWTPVSTAGADRQTAYRVLVASGPELLVTGRADRWDSGIVTSDTLAGVTYAGRPLTSRERLSWSVTLWDAAGRPGPPAVSDYEMGLLGTGDWSARWIGGGPGASAPLLRTELQLPAGDPVVRARAYVAGLGLHELRVNGEVVGDRRLDPAPTTCDHDPDLRDEVGNPTRITRARVPYAVHDIGDLVHPGANAVGLVLGHGWYSAEADVRPMPFGRSPFGPAPRALVQVEVHTASGAVVTVAGSDRWRTAAGPVLYNDLFHGERHDQRLDPVGWDRPGFDDAGWAAAVPVEEPGGELRSQLLEPVRVVATRSPVTVDDRPDGRLIADFGQHVSGWTQLTVSGPAGAEVTVRHAGALDDRGELDDAANMLRRSRARQTDTYTLGGGDPPPVPETWEPRFTLHGFRYAEVAPSSPEVRVHAVAARVAHSDVDRTGTFACGDELLDAIHRNVHWTLRASLQGLPQDAADRAERLAWLGDPGWVIEDYLYELDGLALWAKWLDDLADAQLPDGNLPIVAPLHWRGPLPDALPHVSHLPYAVWPDFTTATYPLIATQLHRFHGDCSVLDRHLPGLVRAVGWMRAHARGHLLHQGFGDHMEPQPDGTCALEAQRTPVALTSTAWYHAAVVAVADAADVVGRADVAAAHRRQAGRIRRAFNDRFLDRATGVYATGSQTALALPLWLGLVPGSQRAAVGRQLVAAVERCDGHLDTGTMGTAALQHALPAIGAADVMLGIARRRTFPSWGHQIEQGATTVWETWGGDPGRSLNMKLLCSINAFLYRDVAGLSPAAPGWSRVAVHPKVTDHLPWASASVRTPHGPASITWHRDGHLLDVTLSLPATTQAEVALPHTAPQVLPGGTHHLVVDCRPTGPIPTP